MSRQENITGLLLQKQSVTFNSQRMKKQDPGLIAHTPLQYNISGRTIQQRLCIHTCTLKQETQDNFNPLTCP